MLNLPLEDCENVTKLKEVLLSYILNELNDTTKDPEVINLLRLLQVDDHFKLLPKEKLDYLYSRLATVINN